LKGNAMLDRTSTLTAELVPSRRFASPPTVLPNDDLDTLIVKANQNYRDSSEYATESVRFAHAMGKVCQRMKEAVEEEFGYGHWGDWFQQNKHRLEFSYRTARLYMQLAKLPEEKWQRVAKMSLREAAGMAASEESDDPGEQQQQDSDDSKFFLDTAVEKVLRHTAPLSDAELSRTLKGQGRRLPTAEKAQELERVAKLYAALVVRP
jgi:hypothetical protein